MPPTLLAITRGFGDALRIGYQERPELFVREIKVAPPLYTDVVEIVERVDAQGTILIALDETKRCGSLVERTQSCARWLYAGAGD